MRYIRNIVLGLGIFLSGGVNGICEEVRWSTDFKLVQIPSGKDGHVQMAYLYGTKATDPAPLVVSLHTWSGDYTQKDTISGLCKSLDLNYIHPDFRGENNTTNACCSELALTDIDEAISYAIENANVDTSRIYVIGLSGGGYATLSVFMKSIHRIKKFSAWVPISDLVAWYRESSIRGNKYAQDILNCTSSVDSVLDLHTAKEKSPIYWDTPTGKLDQSSLHIYTGVNDGVVSITQSINFYNKVLSDLHVEDASTFVSDHEKLELLEYRQKLGEYGKIADREVFLRKRHGGLKLVIFEGSHEILTEYALDELLSD
jgi:poly(3-hydroxybutyrate) depolymerase